MGMAADAVPAPPQIAQASGVEEAGAADIRGGHEKMSAPLRALETVGNRHRAHAAIVERQQQRRRSVLEVDGLDDIDRPIHLEANRGEMIVELCGRQLVARRVAAWKPARVFAARGYHVVVHQRGGSHQQMPR